MDTRGLQRGELSEALAAFKRVFLAIGAFSLVINLLLLAPALYMLQTYDRVLTSRNETTLIALTLILLFLLALEGVLEFVRSRVLVRVSASLDMKLNGRIFDAMFARARSGRRKSERALGDLNQLRQFLAGKGVLALFDVPWLPMYLLAISLLNFWLGLFALLATALLVAMAWFNEKATAGASEQSSALGANVLQQTGATLRNVEAIDGMGMLTALRGRWLEKQNAFLAAQGEVNERSAGINAAVRFFRTAVQSGILGFGAYLVLQDQLTPGGMIAASLLLGRALAPLDQAIGAWRGVVSAREAYLRINGLLQDFPAQQHTISLPAPQGAIEAEGLTVSAPGSHAPILRGLSFRVAPGTAIAVIGPSASGKSTLARALAGVWPSLSGTVRLDGADLATSNREALGSHLGYLPQDVELFDGSIAENIARFGELDSGRIIEAATRAGVHELILHLPNGYETQIGEDGITLSGGQRQRIALARALYGDPALVVLDEPNSNLDEAGDAALLAALRDLRQRHRTVFVVTHRPNLLAETDAVMLLKEGRIHSFVPTAEWFRKARKHLQESRKHEAADAQADPRAAESALMAGG